MTPGRQLWTTEKVAAAVGVSPATVRSWTCRGIIHPFARVREGRVARNVYLASDVWDATARRSTSTSWAEIDAMVALERSQCNAVV